MIEEMVGLIPAAGKGIRLGLPYPKELYPIIRDNRYKPVSQFILDNLTTAGIQHIVFVVNETKHQLIGYFGNGQRFDCHISYVVQETVDGADQSTSPGLAHALDSAYFLTKGKTVCFGMADTIMQPGDVFSHALNQAHAEDDAILIMFKTDRPQKFGMVRVDGDGRVKEIVDKPQETNLREMWGCMIWRPKFSEFLHESVSNGIGDFAKIMNNAIADGMQFRGVSMSSGTYIDLGTYEEIMEMDFNYRDVGRS